MHVHVHAEVQYNRMVGVHVLAHIEVHYNAQVGIEVHTHMHMYILCLFTHEKERRRKQGEL